MAHLLAYHADPVLQGCNLDIAESLNCCFRHGASFILSRISGSLRPLLRYTGDMAQAIVGLELPDLQAALGPDQPAFRARQLYDAVYRQKIADLVQITNLPVSLRKELSSRLAVGLPQPAAEFKSTDGTRRYLLELEDNRTVE